VYFYTKRESKITDAFFEKSKRLRTICGWKAFIFAQRSGQKKRMNFHTALGTLPKLVSVV